MSSGIFVGVWVLLVYNQHTRSCMFSFFLNIIPIPSLGSFLIEVWIPGTRTGPGAQSPFPDH